MSTVVKILHLQCTLNITKQYIYRKIIEVNFQSIPHSEW